MSERLLSVGLGLSENGEKNFLQESFIKVVVAITSFAVDMEAVFNYLGQVFTYRTWRVSEREVDKMPCENGQVISIGRKTVQSGLIDATIENYFIRKDKVLQVNGSYTEGRKGDY